MLTLPCLRTRRWICPLLLIVVAALFPGASASAGFLTVSADSNILNGLNGSNGAITPNDNGVFFRNLLGGGSTVRVLDSNAAAGQGISSTIVNNFYNGISGVTSSLITGPVTSASLAGANLVILEFPSTVFTNSEVAAIGSFLNAGGSVFLSGDSTAFTTQNIAVNAVLTGIGSSLQLAPASLDAGFQLATTTNGQILGNPLNAGVNRLTYAFTSAITGATASQRVLLATNLTSVVIASQSFGPAAVPEPSSLVLCGVAGLIVLGVTRVRSKWVA